MIPVLDPPIGEEPLNLTEAISNLKSCKAVAICDISAELLRASEESMVRDLHLILAVIWQ